MKKDVLILVVMSLLFLTSFASAEILLGQPKSIYNIGDDFEMPITFKSSSDSSNFLTANLVCSDSNTMVELYKSPISAKKDEEKKVALSTQLGNFLVSGVNGECYIETRFGEETSRSQSFEITNRVDVTSDITGAVFSPDETVNIRGTAIKANDFQVNGFAEISVPELGINLIVSVKNGVYNASFQVPSNARAGSYTVRIFVYDKDSSNLIMNQGESSVFIKVRQVMKSLEIAIDKTSVMPGDSISFTVLAYDQAGDYVAAESSVLIKTPRGSEKQSSVVKTQETASFKLEENFEPENWRIEAKSQGFETTKDFFVEEFREIDFKLEGTSLIVTNTGNVPYTGSLDVLINGVSQIKDIENLGVGETETFRLRAPDGEYTIEIAKGGEKVSLGKSYLTGNAISVGGSGAIFQENWLITIWVLIILILLVAALIIYKKVAKRRFIGKASGAFAPQKSSAPLSAIPEKSAITQSGVLNKGQKQECAIISLNIKNLDYLESAKSEGLKAVDSALWQAKEAGAKIYTDRNFRVAVLAPTLSKETEIPVSGIRLAEKIERIISEYNKRSAQRVDFGIAVNVGELIVESSEGKFKFISPDNSVSKTKQLSNFSNKDILISEKAHAKTIGKIRATKMQDRDLWKLEKITDRTAHMDFINKFKQQQKGTNRY